VDNGFQSPEDDLLNSEKDTSLLTKSSKHATLSYLAIYNMGNFWAWNHIWAIFSW